MIVLCGCRQQFRYCNIHVGLPTEHKEASHRTWSEQPWAWVWLQAVEKVSLQALPSQVMRLQFKSMSLFVM